jgi:hypothetical protein
MTDFADRQICFLQKIHHVIHFGGSQFFMEAATVVFIEDPVHVTTAQVQAFGQIVNGQIHLSVVEDLIKESVDDAIDVIHIIFFHHRAVFSMGILKTRALSLDMDQQRREKILAYDTVIGFLFKGFLGNVIQKHIRQ